AISRPRHLYNHCRFSLREIVTVSRESIFVLCRGRCAPFTTTCRTRGGKRSYSESLRCQYVDGSLPLTRCESFETPPLRGHISWVPPRCGSGLRRRRRHASPA